MSTVDTDEELCKRFVNTWNLFQQELQTAFGADVLLDKTAAELDWNNSKQAATERLQILGNQLIAQFKGKSSEDLDRQIDLCLQDTTQSKELLEALNIQNLDYNNHSGDNNKAALRKFIQYFIMLVMSLSEKFEFTSHDDRKHFQENMKNLGLGNNSESFFGEPFGTLMKELTEEFTKDTKVMGAIQEVMENKDIQKLLNDPSKTNPLELLGLLANPNMTRVMKTMSEVMEEKMSNKQFSQKIENTIPEVLGHLTKTMGPLANMMKGGAPDGIDGLAKMFGGLMGGDGASSSGGVDPFGMLAKMMGGDGKKEDDKLPDLDDIEGNVRKQLRKEYREAAQRQALRKKLEERRKKI